MKKLEGPLLVVEDVPNVLELLEVTLRFKGYHVVSAHNGVEGLEKVASQRPALIITDILMPQMDGYAFVHNLRLNPETQVMHESVAVHLRHQDVGNDQRRTLAGDLLQPFDTVVRTDDVIALEAQRNFK